METFAEIDISCKKNMNFEKTEIFQYILQRRESIVEGGGGGKKTRNSCRRETNNRNDKNKKIKLRKNRFKVEILSFVSNPI